jgi:hypothetical protein
MQKEVMMIKRIIILVMVLLLSMLLTTAWAGEAKVTSIHQAATKGKDAFPVLKGPYLGQWKISNPG